MRIRAKLASMIAIAALSAPAAAAPDKPLSEYLRLSAVQDGAVYMPGNGKDLEPSARGIVNARYATGAVRTQLLTSPGDARTSLAAMLFDPGQVLRSIESTHIRDMEEVSAGIARSRLFAALDHPAFRDGSIAFGSVNVDNQGLRGRLFSLYQMSLNRTRDGLADEIDDADIKLVMGFEDLWLTTPSGKPGLSTATSHTCAVSLAADTSLTDAKCVLGMALTGRGRANATYGWLERALAHFQGWNISEHLRFEFPDPEERAWLPKRPYSLSIPVDQYGRNPLEALFPDLKTEYRFTQIKTRESEEFKALARARLPALLGAE